MKNLFANNSKKILLAAPLLATATQADAAVVYTDAGDFNAGVLQNTYFDFAAQTFQGTTAPANYNFRLFAKSVSINIVSPNNAVTTNNVAMTAPAGNLTQGFNFGDTIDGSLNFNNTTGNNSTNWANGVFNYAGFSFNDGSGTRYGWAQYKVDEPGSFDGSITLRGFAYENTGAAITAGQVPEPAQTAAIAGVLAGSVAAFAARRRRKAAKANASA